MEGEWPVALDEDQEEDWRTKPHDEGPTDGGGVQGNRVCQKGKYANDCQYNNDDAASAQVPADSCHGLLPLR